MFYSKILLINVSYNIKDSRTFNNTAMSGKRNNLFNGDHAFDFFN